tara:strand:- start:151 stop:312 length:162 start_codon:yes stop_codon:yes gene_type:complete
VGFSLLLISVIISFIIIIAILVSIQKLNDDPYEDLQMDEWTCPECEFLVQSWE